LNIHFKEWRERVLLGQNFRNAFLPEQLSHRQLLRLFAILCVQTMKQREVRFAENTNNTKIVVGFVFLLFYFLFFILLISPDLFTGVGAVAAYPMKSGSFYEE